jgi:hypothetical protein
MPGSAGFAGADGFASASSQSTLPGLDERAAFVWSKFADGT